MFKTNLLITTIMIFAIVFNIEAGAVPQLINYQGTIKTSEALTKVKLEFNIYDSATVGTKVWGPQVFDNVPVIQGKFNVILGSTDISGKAISDAFDSDQRFIGIKINGADELMPRQQVLSVGYAINANHSVQADRAALADKALNADYASKASNADHASRASNADHASRASNADHATVADRVTTETDPNVPNYMKDGIHWDEVQGKPDLRTPRYSVHISELTNVNPHCNMKNLFSIACAHARRYFCVNHGHHGALEFHDQNGEDFGFICIH
jgi:hypothetical protein